MIEYSIECSIQNKYKLEAASHIIYEAFHLTQHRTATDVFDVISN